MVFPKKIYRYLQRATACVLAVLYLGGCGMELPLPISICPGKKDKTEAISVITAHSESISSLKADGECKLEYHNEKGQERKEQFPIKVRIVPPNWIYLEGGPIFFPKAIVIGANDKEFWAWLKADKPSTYWWGQLSEMADCTEMLSLSPYSVLEALGVVAIEDVESWSLWHKGVYDVLEKKSSDGGMAQRIFINCCDYLPRRMEYFDENGRMILVATLDKYKETIRGFSIPRSIKIIRLSEEKKHDFINIKLNSIEPAQFTRKQLDYIFSRPEPKGFDRVYRIWKNCELIGRRQ